MLAGATSATSVRTWPKAEATNMTKNEIQQEALSRARNGMAWSNYPIIIRGFMVKGIPESEIKPRENVFTFQAWRALGRTVRKGEHGIKVCTFLHMEKEDKETGEKKAYSRPWATTVFHISQTDPLQVTP